MEFQGRGLQAPTEVSQLFRVLIIPFKQDDSTGPDLLQKKGCLAGKLKTRYPHHKKLPQGLFERTIAHPVFQGDILKLIRNKPLLVAG
jgi:hypothetical protein